MSDEWTQTVMMAVMLGAWILIGDRGDRLERIGRACIAYLAEGADRRKARRDFPRAKVRR